MIHSAETRYHLNTPTKTSPSVKFGSAEQPVPPMSQTDWEETRDSYVSSLTCQPGQEPDTMQNFVNVDMADRLTKNFGPTDNPLPEHLNERNVYSTFENLLFADPRSLVASTFETMKRIPWRQFMPQQGWSGPYPDAALKTAVGGLRNYLYQAKGQTPPPNAVLDKAPASDQRQSKPAASGKGQGNWLREAIRVFTGF